MNLPKLKKKKILERGLIDVERKKEKKRKKKKEKEKKTFRCEMKIKFTPAF